VALLKHVVEMKETTLQETHPDRLASLYALARLTQATMIPTHPNRQLSEYNLAYMQSKTEC